MMCKLPALKNSVPLWDAVCGWQTACKTERYISVKIVYSINEVPSLYSHDNNELIDGDKIFTTYLFTKNIEKRCNALAKSSIKVC